LLLLTDYRKFYLNFNRPLDQDEGVSVSFKLQEECWDSTIVDSLSVRKNLEDGDDFSKDRVKARMLQERNGVRLKWPIVPNYFRTRQREMAIAEEEANPKKYMNNTLTLDSEVNKISDDTNNSDGEATANETVPSMKIFDIMFPGSVTCNTSYFNKGAGNPEVDVDVIELFDPDETYVIFKLVLDGKADRRYRAGGEGLSNADKRAAAKAKAKEVKERAAREAREQGRR
jgi:hypothetical protein